MKKSSLILLATIAIISLSSCDMLGKNKKGGALPVDGQLHGVAPAKGYALPKPPGMVYFHQELFIWDQVMKI